MRVSQITAVVAGLIGFSQATPALLDGVIGNNGVKVDKSVGLALDPVKFDLTKGLEDEVLYDGIVQAKTATTAAVHLGLNVHKLAVTGDVDLSVKDEFLVHPVVRLSLAEIKAYVDVDLQVDAAVHESIELTSSPKLSLDLGPLLAAELGVAVALDLVVSVNAAIKASLGFYVEFGASAYVEVDLLTKAVVDVNLDGLVATAQPISVCEEIDLSSGIEIAVGLRLRSQIGIEAGIDIPILPVKAGLAGKADIWLSLFDYTAAIISTTKCTLSATENFAVALGVAVDLEVKDLDVLDISLAPQAMVKVASGPINAKLCLPTLGNPGPFLNCRAVRRPSSSSTLKTIVTTSSTLKTTVTTSSTLTTTVPASTDNLRTIPPSNTPKTTVPASNKPSDPATPTNKAIDPSTPANKPNDPSTPTNKPKSTSTGTNDHTTAHPTTTDPAADELVTSTTRITKVYTVTSCAASVTNCPASLTQKIITSTIQETTVICPATQTGAPEVTATAPVSIPVMTGTKTIVSTIEHITSYFTPPAVTGNNPQPATVVISETTAPSGGYVSVDVPVATGVSTTMNAPGSGSNGSAAPPAGGCPGCPPGGSTATFASVTAPWMATPGVPTPTGSPAAAGAAEFQVSFAALALSAFLALLL